MNKRNLIIGAGSIALAVAWYAFRPELLFVNKTVNEELPTVQAGSMSMAKGTEPMILAKGDFRGLAHETKGEATVHQLADGKRILRLSGFETSNGPDVHVYLVAAEVAKDNATVKQAGFIDLGSLKGNKGDQNYEVPADADLNKYKSVSIWCARFGVNFGAASLAMASTNPTVVSQGDFRGLAHETKGLAAIYQLPDGKRILRLSNFETSNGPDVHVYLIAAEVAKDNATVKQAGFIDLGSMKGNKGDQNYDIPAATDLNKYKSVSIWCARFGVNFGAATLS
ncbi:MAG TPA: DM13 domain-containing protein [Candidatus Binatia bacterium]